MKSHLISQKRDFFMYGICVIQGGTGQSVEKESEREKDGNDRHMRMCVQKYYVTVMIITSIDLTNNRMNQYRSYCK